MNRENGFYWVLLDGKWIIAEYEDEQWKLTGQYMRFGDDHFEQIFEHRLIKT